MDTVSDEDLNVLFSAAMEFGEDWLRPVTELADERVAHLSREQRVAAARAVEQSRAAINKHIAEACAGLGGLLDGDTADDVAAWIVDQYPWMSEENRGRAISQGQYYVWHG